MYFSVKKVEPKPNYLLLLTFENGEKRQFDMKPYLHIGIFKQLQDKKVFKTKEEAIKWVKDHNFKFSSVDETGTSFRFRQQEPSLFVEGSFRTIELRNGVKAVIGTPKKQKSVQKNFWNGIL